MYIFLPSHTLTIINASVRKQILQAITFFALLLVYHQNGFAQLPEKVVNHQAQFWVSLNSTSRISERWAIIGDIHLRRNNFWNDPSFFLIRGAGQYAVLPNFTVAAGYAHMWIAPSRADWQKFVNENRIYQQAIFTTKLGSVNLLQRVRNEQRWQQIIIDDVVTGKWRFTNRLRYLVSATIPISKNIWIPRPVIAQEILIHFGKPIVYNTFDQNRLFLGIRQQVTESLSFDFGYMNLYQQKFSGFEYDMNHTLRLFFYYTPDLRKGQKSKHREVIMENPG